MFSDWAVWDLTDYREMLIEVTVASGLFTLLQSNDTEEIREPFDQNTTRRVLEALRALGVVEERPDGGHRWIGPMPDTRSLCRWGAARRWLGLAERMCHAAPLSAPDTVVSPFLVDTAPVLAEWMRQVIAPKPGIRWLDVGGGQGTWAQCLWQAGVEVTLAEQPGVCPPHLRRGGLHVWEGDIFRQLPDSGPFDGISLVRFIEDWSVSQLEELLSRLAQCLADSGTLYVVGYFRDRTHWAALFDVNVMVSSRAGVTYEVESLKQIAASAGLQLTTIIDANFDTYTLMGFQKMPGGASQ